MNQLSIFLRFCRLHTIIATSLQVSGLFVVAISSQSGVPNSAPVWLWALAACLCANIYIVGLNQLVDIDIDRINKPNLPLASGELALNHARWIVLGAALVSAIIAFSQSWILLLTVLISMLIGSLYSLEPIHLKRRPFWAAFSIAFVRGFVANFGLMAHFYMAFRTEIDLPWALALGLAAFFFGFGLVIALYKDMPDLIGDRTSGIRTFSVEFGPDRVFAAGRWILTSVYFIPALWGILRLPNSDGAAVLTSHLLILAIFWRRSLSVDLNSPADITRFYLFLWGLFYIEYLLLALGALLA